MNIHKQPSKNYINVPNITLPLWDCFVKKPPKTGKNFFVTQLTFHLL